MKLSLAAALLALLAGCANGDLEREYVPHSGLVKSIETVDVDRIEGKSGVRSGVFFGFGTGNRRSTGMAMSFPLFGEEQNRDVFRYEIDLPGEGPVVVYHRRRQFEIDDCVLVRIHPDAERHPPKIQGSSDDCEPVEE